MSLSQQTIDLYRAEYETSPDLTIPALCAKYSITENDLGSTDTWEKFDPNTIVPEVVQAPLQTKTLDKSANEEPKERINYAKKLTLDEVIARLEVERHSLDIKEIKELQTIIDMIEKSYKGANDGTNINILVQNILAKVEDDV